MSGRVRWRVLVAIFRRLSPERREDFAAIMRARAMERAGRGDYEALAATRNDLRRLQEDAVSRGR